jgi:5-formyltetrahydrofolate cyclo-ligase
MPEPRDKRVLRRELGQRRDALDQRETRSATICRRVMDMPVYRAAHALHCYLPMRSEVDTHPLIHDALAQGKHVIVPVVEAGATELSHTRLTSLVREELVDGVFGTPQPHMLTPVPVGAWDMIIVPLLGFSRAGYRLGYGKGYYDRLLTATPGIPAIGVAFAAQEVAHLPHEAHDIPLTTIITEDEVIDCTGYRASV